MDSEKRAFLEKLYNDYSERLYAYVYCRTGDYDLSIDIVLETYLTAAEKIDEVYDHPNRLGWLYKTVKFKTLEACRKKYVSDGKSGRKYPVEVEALDEQNGNIADEKDCFEEIIENDAFEEYGKLLSKREFEYITYRYKDERYCGENGYKLYECDYAVVGCKEET
ncbi:MAG: sigma-70 family RNA polymerase sigma factor [Clostridiales bacterium]|nr:sigma-70 family RNA polymerase sigma factor [Clostridiales bacterium]